MIWAEILPGLSLQKNMISPFGKKRVDALMVLTSAAGLMTTDSLRRVLEDMGADAYETMTYYERWIASIAQNMVEAGAVTTEELGAKMAEVRARGATYGAAS